MNVIGVAVNRKAAGFGSRCRCGQLQVCAAETDAESSLFAVFGAIYIAALRGMLESSDKGSFTKPETLSYYLPTIYLQAHVPSK